MSNSSYKYAGLPLTPLMLQELILELLKGQTLHKQEMTDIISDTSRGGNPPRSKQTLHKQEMTDIIEATHAELYA